MFTRVLMEVAGVGLLLCLPVLVGQPVDVVAWLLTCTLGLAVGAATRTALAHHHDHRDIVPADAVEHNVVDSWYVGGILAGQVFLCGFTGFLLAHAFGIGRASGPLGLGVLVVSGLLGMARPTISEPVKRTRTVLTVLTALAWAWWPMAAGTTGPPSLVGSPSLATTALLFFVSIVGWEVRRSWSPAERVAGSTTLIPVYLVVAVVGTGLILLRLARASAAVPAAVGPALAVVVTLLAVSYCRTNLVAAANLTAKIRGSGTAHRTPGLVAMVAVPVLITLALAALCGWKPGYFLYGPAAMTLFIFFWLAARVATNTRAAVVARVAGALGAGALLVLSPSLGTAIAFPVVVGIVSFGWRSTTRALVRTDAPESAETSHAGATKAS
jgi:hypothetical protein